MSERSCPSCHFIGTFVFLGSHQMERAVDCLESLYECPACGFEVSEISGADCGEIFDFEDEDHV